MRRVKFLKNACIGKIDLVPAGAQQDSEILITKSKEVSNLETKVEKEFTPEQIEEMKGLIHQLKIMLHCDEAENEVKENNTDEIVEAEKSDTEEVKEEVNEEVKEPESDVVKAALQKAADLEAENSKLQEEVKKMNDEKVTQQFISKASEMSNIPGMSTNELGKVLKSVSENCDNDTFNNLMSVLKAANEAIGTGSLFVEKGSFSNNSGDPQTADEAYSMLEMLANQRVTKGESTTSNCMADVLKTEEGTRLYNKYLSLKGV